MLISILVGLGFVAGAAGIAIWASRLPTERSNLVAHLTASRVKDDQESQKRHTI